MPVSRSVQGKITPYAEMVPFLFALAFVGPACHGWLGGWLAWALSPTYRRRFLDNVHQAGLGWRTVLGAVGQAGCMSAELPRLWLGRPAPVQWAEDQAAAQAYAAGKGVLFLTPHMGCFEVTAQALASRFGGEHGPLTVLYRPARHAGLAEVMALEADRMQNLTMDKNEFAKEIKVVMEERRLRTDDQPIAKVYEALNATAYVASPYHNPIVGWMDDLQNMTATDALAWYERWYAPNNAIMVVTGDVDAQQVRAMAEKYFGKIPVKTLPKTKPQNEPPQNGIRRVVVKAPAENPYVVLAFKVPTLRDVEKDEDVHAGRPWLRGWVRLLDKVRNRVEDLARTERVLLNLSLVADAGEDQHCVQTGFDSSHHIGVHAVANHASALAVRLNLVHGRAEHHWVGLANNVRFTTGGFGNQRGNRAGCGQHALGRGPRGIGVGGNKTRAANNEANGLGQVFKREVAGLAKHNVVGVDVGLNVTNLV